MVCCKVYYLHMVYYFSPWRTYVSFIGHVSTIRYWRVRSRYISKTGKRWLLSRLSGHTWWRASPSCSRRMRIGWPEKVVPRISGKQWLSRWTSWRGRCRPAPAGRCRLWYEHSRWDHRHQQHRPAEVDTKMGLLCTSTSSPFMLDWK